MLVFYAIRTKSAVNLERKKMKMRNQKISFKNLLIYIEKGIFTEKNRDKDFPFAGSLPKQWLELSRPATRSQEFLLGLLSGCRCQRLWAILHWFPKPQTRSMMGSWASRTWINTHMKSQCVQGENLATGSSCRDSILTQDSNKDIVWGSVSLLLFKK